MLSRRLKCFGITSALVAVLLLCSQVAQASADPSSNGNASGNSHTGSNATNGVIRRDNGNTHHGIIHATHGDASAIPSAVAVEIKHQRTIAMRDIGDILADLQLAQKNYNRIKELYDEDIAPKKDLDAADSALKRKEIDLLTRRAALSENEAAILRKHHLPAPTAPVVTEEQINRILEQDESQHTYAQTR